MIVYITRVYTHPMELGDPPLDAAEFETYEEAMSHLRKYAQDRDIYIGPNMCEPGAGAWQYRTFAMDPDADVCTLCVAMDRRPRTV